MALLSFFLFVDDVTQIIELVGAITQMNITGGVFEVQEQEMSNSLWTGAKISQVLPKLDNKQNFLQMILTFPHFYSDSHECFFALFTFNLASL